MEQEPSTAVLEFARRCYEKRLKKKAFYFIYKECDREKKTNLIKQHHDKQNINRVLLFWAQLAADSQEHERLDQNSRRFRYLSLVKKIFTILRKNICIEDSKLERARDIYAENLLRTVFDAWQGVRDKLSLEAESIWRIVARREQETKQRVFDAWNEVRISEKHQLLTDVEAVKFYVEKLMKRAFTQWRGEVLMKQERRREEDAVCSQAREILMHEKKRHIFLFWKNDFIEWEKRKRGEARLANDFLRVRRLRIVFDAIRIYATHQKEKASKIIKANAFYLAPFFYEWTLFRMEEVRAREQERAAFDFRRKKLMQMYFDNWKDYWERHQLYAVSANRVSDVPFRKIVKNWQPFQYQQPDDDAFLRECSRQILEMQSLVERQNQNILASREKETPQIGEATRDYSQLMRDCSQVLEECARAAGDHSQKIRERSRTPISRSSPPPVDLLEESAHQKKALTTQKVALSQPLGANLAESISPLPILKQHRLSPVQFSFSVKETKESKTLQKAAFSICNLEGEDHWIPGPSIAGDVSPSSSLHLQKFPHFAPPPVLVPPPLSANSFASPANFFSSSANPFPSLNPASPPMDTRTIGGHYMPSPTPQAVSTAIPIQTAANLSLSPNPPGGSSTVPIQSVANLSPSRANNHFTFVSPSLHPSSPPPPHFHPHHASHTPYSSGFPAAQISPVVNGNYHFEHNANPANLRANTHTVHSANVSPHANPPISHSRIGTNPIQDSSLIHGNFASSTRIGPLYFDAAGMTANLSMPLQQGTRTGTKVGADEVESFLQKIILSQRDGSFHFDRHFLESTPISLIEEYMASLRQSWADTETTLRSVDLHLADKKDFSFIAEMLSDRLQRTELQSYELDAVYWEKQRLCS